MNTNSTLPTDALDQTENSSIELSAEVTPVTPEPISDSQEVGDSLNDSSAEDSSQISSLAETPETATDELVPEDAIQDSPEETAAPEVSEETPEAVSSLSESEPESLVEIQVVEDSHPQAGLPTDAEPEEEKPVADLAEVPVPAAEAETETVASAPTADVEEVVATPAVSEPVPPSEHDIRVVEDHELEEMEKEDAELIQEDYTGLDKEQLVKIAEQLNRDSDPLIANRAIQKIRPIFEALYAHDKAEALEKYVTEGGEPDTFEFKHHSLEQRFFQAQKGIFEKRKLSQEFQQKERGKNLEAKLTLLEQLRKLVDDHEHTPGYDKFKVIREEWKKIGPVGPEHAQNLNASYYSLIERFYSLSEIYHNLRDFDRKKNLDLKLELISKIEKLAEEPMISKAMKDLMNYQEEYRSLGPVPKDRLDEIKDRLKKGVDVIYERRRAFNEDRKKLLHEEIALKEALVEKIAEFETFVGATARDWQAKTKELLQLQEEWKAIPGRFREKTADMNKQFWTIFKKFMNAKNDFFRQLEKGKKDVLASKQALVDEVNSLKDGEDWDGIANRMKQLQNEWRQIAPVFGKEGQKVYDEFKAGIDHFFTRLRGQRTGEEKVQTENLEAKEAICAEIEALAASGKGTRKKVDELRDQFRNIGFVPMKSIQKINGRFSKAMMDMIDAATEIAEGEKERLKINLLSSRATYSSEGVKTLRNQEGYIQKRLQQLRKDVGNLEDNVSMFKMSKNAMALIEDVQKRINLFRLEIKELESQLREIRNADRPNE
jgi:hypothetical protein